MVMMAVRGGYVCVFGWVVGGGVRRYFQHNRGSLPADVLWGSFVTHSFLPHGRLLNTADIYVHQSQAVYRFL